MPPWALFTASSNTLICLFILDSSATLLLKNNWQPWIAWIASQPCYSSEPLWTLILACVCAGMHNFACTACENTHTLCAARLADVGHVVCARGAHP
eukprot:659971-Pelagomonas_calceolata.AAC.8